MEETAFVEAVWRLVLLLGGRSSRYTTCCLAYRPCWIQQRTLAVEVLWSPFNECYEPLGRARKDAAYLSTRWYRSCYEGEELDPGRYCLGWRSGLG